LHFLAAAAITSAQYGHLMWVSVVAAGLAGVAILHPPGLLGSPNEFWGTNVIWRFGLLFDFLGLAELASLEVSTLAREVSEVNGKHPDQKHFYIVYQAFVFYYIPAEMVPGVFPPFIFVCAHNTRSYVSFPDVDRRGAVIQDVNALPTLLFSGHTLIFYIFRVPRPSLTELFDQFHRIFIG
jgi:hypothetical protein